MRSLLAALCAWRSAAEARSRRGAGGADPVLADLLRLRAAVRHDLPDGWTRRVALLTAYEDVLLQACERHGVGGMALRELGRRQVHDAMRIERDLARMRTEADLEAFGVTLDS